jgi:abortive infection bacteriophage resistance protein
MVLVCLSEEMCIVGLNTNKRISFAREGDMPFSLNHIIERLTMQPISDIQKKKKNTGQSHKALVPCNLFTVYYSFIIITNMSKTEEATTWIDKQAESPLPIWALSGLCKVIIFIKKKSKTTLSSFPIFHKALAMLPLAVKKSPGIPSMFQTMAFSAIFAGAG